MSIGFLAFGITFLIGFLSALWWADKVSPPAAVQIVNREIQTASVEQGPPPVVIVERGPAAVSNQVPAPEEQRFTESANLDQRPGIGVIHAHCNSLQARWENSVLDYRAPYLTYEHDEKANAFFKQVQEKSKNWLGESELESEAGPVKVTFTVRIEPKSETSEQFCWALDVHFYSEKMNYVYTSSGCDPVIMRVMDDDFYFLQKTYWGEAQEYFAMLLIPMPTTPNGAVRYVSQNSNDWKTTPVSWNPISDEELNHLQTVRASANRD